MFERTAGQSKALIVGIGMRVCAVPLTHVIETMRPLPIEPISGVPSFVRGISIIRGIPTPVVELGGILGTRNESTGGRFVTVRAGDRQVALLVDTVLGIRDLDPVTAAQELPPLLQEASRDVIEKIGTLDNRFLMILQAAWRLPEETWQAVTAQEAVL